MSKILTLFLLMSLSACFPPDRVDKRQQDYVCLDRGGVNTYAMYGGDASRKVQCMDGSYQMWHLAIIPQHLIEVEDGSN